MGLETDENIWKWDNDVVYALQERNEGQLNKKSVPVAKSAIIDIFRILSELEKFIYLRSLANVFESMNYDSNDWNNEKKSFLMVCM